MLKLDFQNLMFGMPKINAKGPEPSNTKHNFVPLSPVLNEVDVNYQKELKKIKMILE